MIKKTTFALAGALGMVAAAAISTTAGAAEDSALVGEVDFYTATNFGPTATPGVAEADCKPTPVTTAKSAKLTGTGQVALYKAADCNPADLITVLSVAFPDDSGDPTNTNSPGTLLLGTDGAKSFKLVQ